VLPVRFFTSINPPLTFKPYRRASWGPNEAVMNRSGCSGEPLSFRTIASVALALVLAGPAIGCKTLQEMEITGALGAAPAQQSDADRRSSATWGERYRANPNDPEVAINYAHALRAIDQRAQSVTVLERALLANPEHKGVLGAYGRALADAGNYKQALDVLNRAHTPGQPDWRILSVQGAALDQMGRHVEAQRYYGTALRIVPDEPSVLSNLGLSYALSKDLVRAETTLRRAAAHARVDPQVRKNLALVVRLQERFSEAERTHLHQMLAQQNGWTQPGQPGRT
jgi:Flp pilus assembly protein TadD